MTGAKARAMEVRLRLQAAELLAAAGPEGEGGERAEHSGRCCGRGSGGWPDRMWKPGEAGRRGRRDQGQAPQGPEVRTFVLDIGSGSASVIPSDPMYTIYAATKA